jgi:RND family efflux transporter MFP subunit
VTISQPVVRTVADYGEYTGYLDAVQRVEIRPRIRGRIDKVYFREGTELEKGTLLYEIDPREYQVARDEAQAALNRAVADQRRAAAELERAQAALQRTTQLRETGGVSKDEYDQAVATHKTANAAVGQADAALDQARAKLAATELDLSFTKIHAPIDGRISRTLVTEGNLVGYNEPTQLTVMVDVDPIYVFFDVPERDAIAYEAKVKPVRSAALLVGGVAWLPLWSDAMIPVEVGIETETGYPHVGVINFREPRFESGSGTVRLRGVVDNFDRKLSSGMYARVRFPTGPRRDRLMIPEQAILSDQRGRYVLVVGADDVVQYRAVGLGPVLGKLVAVEQGLKADDWVIVAGVQKARPKTPVKPDRKPLAEPPAPTS